MAYITLRKAVEFLGLHPNTLRKYADEGKINSIKNEAGQRLYDVESYQRNSANAAVICYCRVSSAKQRDDLDRQIEFMRDKYPDADIVKDIGSGLNFKRKGLQADICFHDLNSHNPHAHIMLTMRELVVDADGIADFGKKKRNKNKEYYEDTEHQPYQSWDDRKLIAEQRQNWEILANQYLAKAGHDIKIDCRSLAEQGIDRIPQIHLGPKVMAMRARGIRTERGDQYQEIEIENAELAAERNKKPEADRSDELSQIDREYLNKWLVVEQISEVEEEIQSQSQSQQRVQPKPNRGRGR